MINPKPLIIIIWACQEMMSWMSMGLIGSMDILRWISSGRILAQKLGNKSQLIFVKPYHNKSDPA
jgi:hypothetical protein